MLSCLVLAASMAAVTARVEAVAVGDQPAALRVNGELSEELWQRAPAVENFLQREPEEGGKPSERTEFRILYDATTLFVRVHAFDADPARVVGYLTRRDQDSPSDWIRVLI